MKQLIASLVLLVVLAGTIWYADTYMDETSGQMLSALEDMQRYQAEENYAQAEEAGKRLQAYWNECRNGWHALVMHSDLNTLEQTLSRTLSFQRTQNDQFFSECEAFRTILGHIPHMLKISWDNIF